MDLQYQDLHERGLLLQVILMQIQVGNFWDSTLQDEVQMSLWPLDVRLLPCTLWLSHRKLSHTPPSSTSHLKGNWMFWAKCKDMYFHMHYPIELHTGKTTLQVRHYRQFIDEETEAQWDSSLTDSTGITPKPMFFPFNHAVLIGLV